MEETTKPQRKYVGNGRKRLSNIEILERVVRKELDALWKKANKKGGTGLSAEDVRKLESLTRSQKNLDERAAALKTVEIEAETEFDDMTPEQIRAAVNDLKQKAKTAVNE